MLNFAFTDVQSERWFVCRGASFTLSAGNRMGISLEEILSPEREIGRSEGRDAYLAAAAGTRSVRGGHFVGHGSSSDSLPLRMVGRTLIEVLLFLAQMKSVMNQTKSGSRIVLFTGPASTKKKTVRRKQPEQWLSTSCRIALIRHGELVSGQPSR